MGGAAWKQLWLIENVWEKVGLQPVLLQFAAGRHNRESKTSCSVHLLRVKA